MTNIGVSRKFLRRRAGRRSEASAPCVLSWHPPDRTRSAGRHSVSTSGHNPDDDRGSIHQITGLENGVHISGSCSLLSSGGVDCWGGREWGQLGNGTVSYKGSEDTAVSATGITNASAISGNAYDACAVLADGTVRCWGENGDGQLGNGQEGFSPVPVRVVGLP